MKRSISLGQVREIVQQANEYPSILSRPDFQCYRTGDRGDITRDNFPIGIFDPDKGCIAVHYNLQYPNQILAAIDFRNFLKNKGMPFEETPSIREAVNAFLHLYGLQATLDEERNGRGKMSEITSKLKSFVIGAACGILLGFSALTGLNYNSNIKPLLAYDRDLNNDRTNDLVVLSNQGEYYPLIKVKENKYISPELLRATKEHSEQEILTINSNLERVIKEYHKIILNPQNR